MANKILERLIDFAIAEERKSAALYLEVLRRIKDKGTRAMLKDMAEMEKAHGQKLEEFKAGKGPGPVPEKVPNLQLAEYMVENKLTDNALVQDVILFAIQCEKKAHQMYSDIAKIYREGPKKEFMDALASEELKHKNSLERAYDDNIFQEN
jgi:rubrerythrin